MISTRNLSKLPLIDELRRLNQSLAMLDAILERDWPHRYYSFNAHWGVGVQLASMRNGQGDFMFCAFCAGGAFVKGFCHDSLMSPAGSGTQNVWPGVLDNIPATFNPLLSDPALMLEETTFFIWMTYGDSTWQTGNISFPDGEDPDGSVQMLMMFDGEARTYTRWAEKYHKRSISLVAVEHIYAHRMLTNEIVKALNPNVNIETLLEDVVEIGYPHKTSDRQEK